MPKYYHRAFAEKNQAGWEIVEENTKYIVARSFFEEDVKSYTRFLEKSSAFSGLTPKFFTEPVLILSNK